MAIIREILRRNHKSLDVKFLLLKAMSPVLMILALIISIDTFFLSYAQPIHANKSINKVEKFQLYFQSSSLAL